MVWTRELRGTKGSRVPRSLRAEAPHEVVDALRERIGVWHLAVGRHPVDDFRQERGETARRLVRADPCLPRDLIEAVVPEDLRHRVRRDRLVLATAHPGVGLLREACPLQLLEESTKAAEPARPASTAASDHLPPDLRRRALARALRRRLARSQTRRRHPLGSTASGARRASAPSTPGSCRLLRPAPASAEHDPPQPVRPLHREDRREYPWEPPCRRD